MVLEQSRDRIENEGDLKAQEFTIASLRATIERAPKRIAQLASNYRRELQNERVDVEAQYARLRQDADKQFTRRELLELRAPQDGIVKDLATHTVRRVLSPGTVVMTLVAVNDPMQAEVWATHDDAGFVVPKQPVKRKFATYPFQKYGMIDGELRRVSPDASEIGEGGSAKAGESAAPARATGRSSW